MKPNVAAAWSIVRQGLSEVSCKLAEHQQLQNAAAAVEAALSPKPKEKKTPPPPPARR